MAAGFRAPASDRGDDRSTATDTWLAALVVACSLASLLYAVALAPRPAPDGIDGLLGLYARVAADLPPEPRIGFVSLIADRDAAGATAYAAQYTLAPRVLDADLGRVTYAITTPHAPSTVDDDPRLAGFAPVATSADGVRIYRRRD